MLSRPDIVHQDYNNDAIENAYVFATSEGAKTKVDWEKGTWYVAPNDDGFIQWLPQVEEGIDVCGISLPFTSEAHLNAGYTNPKN